MSVTTADGAPRARTPGAVLWWLLVALLVASILVTGAIGAGIGSRWAGASRPPLIDALVYSPLV